MSNKVLNGKMFLKIKSITQKNKDSLDILNLKVGLDALALSVTVQGF